MEIRLPFHYDVDVYCECPIFYKLAVMKNHQNYNDWLFNHGGVFMDEEFNTYLGRFGQRLRMEDFAPLLEFIPIDYRAFPSDEELIETMVRVLSEGDYVLLEQGYLNKSAFIQDRIWLHETVFYAIDTDKRTACSPDLRNGHFSEREQSFEEILDCHRLLLEFYREHEYFAQVVKEHAFPMCRVRLRKDGREEANMMQLFHMLEQDFASGKTTVEYFDRDQGRERQYVYRGSSEIFRGYREWLGMRETQNPEDRMWIRMSHGIFKYMEHVKMLHKKAELLFRAGMPFDFAPIKELQETLELLRAMAFKWEMTGNDELISRLDTLLDRAFVQDRCFIWDLLNHMRPFLTSSALPSTNPYCLIRAK